MSINIFGVAHGPAYSGIWTGGLCVQAVHRLYHGHVLTIQLYNNNNCAAEHTNPICHICNFLESGELILIMEFIQYAVRIPLY